MFATLLGASIVMLFIAYHFKKAALAYAAAGLWITFAVYSYALSATPAGAPWDIYYALTWVGVGMVLMCALEPTIMKDRQEDLEGDIKLSEVDSIEKQFDDLSKQTRIPRIGRKRPEEFKFGGK